MLIGNRKRENENEIHVYQSNKRDGRGWQLFTDLARTYWDGAPLAGPSKGPAEGLVGVSGRESPTRGVGHLDQQLLVVTGVADITDSDAKDPNALRPSSLEKSGQSKILLIGSSIGDDYQVATVFISPSQLIQRQFHPGTEVGQPLRLQATQGAIQTTEVTTHRSGWMVEDSVIRESYDSDQLAIVAASKLPDVLPGRVADSMDACGGLTKGLAECRAGRARLINHKNIRRVRAFGPLMWSILGSGSRFAVDLCGSAAAMAFWKKVK